ncbi:MAG: hypothetical protein Q8K70_00020 [Bacteroidota bacterium]|nr:hypothetical protein [Bacteroidota bacterium]
MKFNLFILFFLSIFSLNALDTLKYRFLYHPNNSFYSLHGMEWNMTRGAEFFFIIQNNRVNLPGFGIEDYILKRKLKIIFDSSICNENNKVYYLIKNPKTYFETLESKIAFEFYVFDIELVIDRIKTTEPLGLFTLNPKKKGRFITMNENPTITIPNVVNIISVKPVLLRNHKLKKNGKIYPVR